MHALALGNPPTCAPERSREFTIGRNALGPYDALRCVLRRIDDARLTRSALPHSPAVPAGRQLSSEDDGPLGEAVATGMLSSAAAANGA